MNTVSTKQRLYDFLLTMICVFGVAGCAMQGGQKVSGAEGAPAAKGELYRIGPGDSVNIFVWGNSELSSNVPVRPDGMITTPLVEDVVASGKTSTELARDMEKHLGKYVKNPVVTVIVTSFVGLYEDQIRIVGEATNPQNLSYKQDMTLLDVMIASGGLTSFAAGNRATIIRTSDGKQQQISVRLDDLIKDGDISANVFMQAGDILIIPEAWF